MPESFCPFCGLRESARAGMPAWESSRRSSLPMTPVPPVKRIMDASACYGYGQNGRGLCWSGVVEPKANEGSQNQESVLAPGVSPIDEEPRSSVLNGDGGVPRTIRRRVHGDELVAG